MTAARMRVLLDTDAVIDLLKGFEQSVHLLQTLYRDGSEFTVCAIVVAEVYAGLDPIDRPKAERFLGVCTFLRCTHEIARQAGEWRYRFRRQGRTISLTDALIAATAHANGATLVTGNVSHYPMTDIDVLPLPRSGAAG